MILDNRIALDYLLAEQERACAIGNTTCYTWIDTSGSIANTRNWQTSYWLKQVDGPSGTFFDLFNTNCFGSLGSWRRSILSYLGIILLIVITVVSLVRYVFSKVFNSSSQPSAAHQMVLRETDTRWTMRGMAKSIIPGNWHHHVQASQWSKSNLILMAALMPDCWHGWVSCQNLSNRFHHWQHANAIIKTHTKLVLPYYQRSYKTYFFWDLILILHGSSPPTKFCLEKCPFY